MRKRERKKFLDTKRMEEIRAEKGWTQQQAAERCGLGSKQRWSTIVHGDKTDRRLDNVKLDVLYRLADGLGVHPAELLME